MSGILQQLCRRQTHTDGDAVDPAEMLGWKSSHQVFADFRERLRELVNANYEPERSMPPPSTIKASASRSFVKSAQHQHRWQ